MVHLKIWFLRAAKPAVAPVDPDISSIISLQAHRHRRAIVTHGTLRPPNYSLIRSISSFWALGPPLPTWAQKFQQDWIVTFTVTQSHLTTTFGSAMPSIGKSQQIRQSLMPRIYEVLMKIINDIDWLLTWKARVEFWLEWKTAGLRTFDTIDHYTFDIRT